MAQQFSAKLWWLTMTPFGRPVLPEVYWIKAMSFGSPSKLPAIRFLIFNLSVPTQVTPALYRALAAVMAAAKAEVDKENLAPASLANPRNLGMSVLS